jgi:hypothetical protein
MAGMRAPNPEPEELRGWTACPGCKTPMKQSERCDIPGCPCFRMLPRSAQAQAFERELARLQAGTLREDKRAMLFATEVRNGQQAGRWLDHLKDSWYDEAIPVEIVHVEGA